MGNSTFIQELSHRGVFRVAAAYLVSAWAIAKIAQLMLEEFSAPDWGMQAVLVVLLVAFPVVLVLTWQQAAAIAKLDFELGEDVASSGAGLSIVRPDSDQSLSSTGVTTATGEARKLTQPAIWLTGVLLALSIIYFALQGDSGVEGRQELEQEIPATQAKSIAVLPFLDLSAEAGNEYFSDGISEELLNLLAKIPELRVISRSSSFSYRDKDIEIPTIAKQLNVGHVLEGSVRKVEEKVRINVRLIEAKSDTQLWSERYDRDLVDVLALQDEISTEVVRQLKIVLLDPVPESHVSSPEVYSLYLQARHLSRQGTEATLSQATEKFEQVVDSDSSYADAWAELGLAQIRQARFNIRSEEAAYADARNSLERAIAIDPRHAVAHSRLGWLAAYQNLLAEAAAHLEVAMSAAPNNSSVLVNASQLLTQLSRHSEAVELAKRAAVVDPAGVLTLWNLSYSLYFADHMALALASARTAVQLNPAYAGIHDTIGSIFLLEGNFASALENFQRETANDLKVRGTAMAMLSLGKNGEFQAALQQLRDTWGESRPAEVAAAYIWAGDFDSGFHWLQRAVDAGDRRLYLVISNPLLRAIHEDKRWLPFLERIGRSPDQLADIKFNIE